MIGVKERRGLTRLITEALCILPILAGLVWLFFGRFLKEDYSAAIFQDNTHFILPLFFYISKSFAAGEFPYWINSIVGGVPLYNTPQFGLLYPLYFFGWNLYRTPLDTSLHVHYVTVLHVAILWINTYVMMRVFRLRVMSALVGATIFAFSANTYRYMTWINIISPYSWFPLALASVFLILEDEYPKTGLALSWLSIYLLVSASPAQPLIHFVYCSAFLAGSYAVIHWKQRSRLKVPGRNLILLAAGSLLLTSATLIPDLLFSQRDMVRWVGVRSIAGDQKIPFEDTLLGQAKPRELAKIFFPLGTDQLSGDSYLGMLPILLAFFGLFKAKKNWTVIPLFILGAYTLLSSTGASLGFAQINYVIPLWNKIREPARHLYIFGLAFSLLAAFGFEYLTERDRPRGNELWKHAYVLGPFLILLLWGYSVRQKYGTLVQDSVLLWSFVLFLGVLYVMPRLARLNHRFWQVSLVAVLLIPAVSYPIPIGRMQNGDYFTQENLRSHRVLQELGKIQDIRDYRTIVVDDGFSAQYWAMNAIYYGVRTFDAFMNPLPRTQSAEMSLVAGFPRYARLLGAKYYLHCSSLGYTSQPRTDDIEWPEERTGRITLTNPKTGKLQILDAGLRSRLAELTYFQGWVPLNDHGHLYQVIDFLGGQMFVDPDRRNRAAPLNVIVGGSWSHSQLAALPLFLEKHPAVRGGLELPTAYTSVDTEPATSDQGSPGGYVFERQIEGCKLYSTPDTRPYFFVSTEVGAYNSAQQFMDMINGSDFYLNKVVISSRDASTVSAWLGASQSPLDLAALREKRSRNTFDLSLKTNRRALLVLNEYFRDDWQATVNGVRQKPLKVNLNQIGVLLPKGSSDIHFEYRPPLFVWLLYAQRAAFVLLAAGLVVGAFRKP